MIAEPIGAADRTPLNLYRMGMESHFLPKGKGQGCRPATALIGEGSKRDCSRLLHLIINRSTKVVLHNGTKGVFLLRRSKAPCCSLKGCTEQGSHLYSKPTSDESFKNVLEPSLLPAPPRSPCLSLWLCANHTKEGAFNPLPCK